MTAQHPMRTAEKKIYKCVDSNEHIGRFLPAKTYPMIFSGDSAEEVEQKMDAFATECADKNEANYIARSAAIEKARKARAAKKKA